MTQISPATLISMSTVRLVAIGRKAQNVGTGYFYIFDITDPATGHVTQVPTIITNKHVVKGVIKLKAIVQLIAQGAAISEQASASNEERKELLFEDLSFSMIPHPDDEVDLCCILCGQHMNILPDGVGLKNFFVSNDARLDPELRASLRPLEPIVMIGYPNGLWDEANNRPVARRGQTASHALVNWNGRKEFLIDAACFPGSSGSPVFLYEDGMYRTETGYTPGSRIKLLGTLWGGPSIDAEGRLIPKPIPTTYLDQNEEKIPVVRLMMNLGFVIHADALDDFPAQIAKRIG